MKYLLSAVLLAGAAFVATMGGAAAPASAQAHQPELDVHYKRIDGFRKRHGALKPVTPEHKKRYDEFLKRFDAHIKDLDKAVKIADAKERAKEGDRIGKELDKTEKDLLAYENDLKGAKAALPKHPKHDGFVARLKDLRKRHAALKPKKPEDLKRHEEFVKRFDRHDADLEKAARIEKAEDRNKEYDRIEKDIQATEKDFGVLEKQIVG